MARPAFAHIDLGALRHNYRLARRLHGGRSLAVLKANAYGHGAVRCAQALDGLADGYAVAFLEEALPLRAAGLGAAGSGAAGLGTAGTQAPILVLEGLFDADELQVAHAQGLWFAVHQESQLRMLEQATHLRGLHVWLKIDSGMGRAGFAPAQAASAHARLRACAAVDEITLMTHFARADEPGHGMTQAQVRRFDEATAGLPGDRSLCNSAGLLAWPEARRDWGRVGIALYGADPLAESTAGLRPVMGLHSQVFAVRTLQPGEPLGYGARHVAQRPTRVGLVAMGYADGYPRTAPNGTPVAVDGQPAPLIGRVSMDMLTVDLTDLPEAGIGSAVELWGPRIDVNTVAQAAGTIAYELLCNVKRVPLRYTDGDDGAAPAHAHAHAVAQATADMAA
ncbi:MULTISPECIES: alanine racemase [Burkholderiales]|uniref:alanine racemase n=1 Tax=Burkholderiales TaxID=80840 RepID=UPI0008A3672F|nr:MULTISPECIES: alanine racemase [Burkholderiales]MCT9017110.1 alanine racemase [Cupriavidus gilardii]MCT9056780.1 alanine racemase [Cupriavidus gilardii]HCA6665410.1 alanine racemase [Pseudomonas aeruginosa]